MEEAVFISDIKGLKFLLPKHKRLYFGNEFCERLLPTEEELKLIRGLVNERGIGFTLVTPLVTDKGLKSLVPVLKYVLDSFINPEIVINDWGVLRLIKEEFRYSNLALGRLLTRQKSDPRISCLKHNLPFQAEEYFKQGCMDSELVSDFLSRAGIKRIELDNLLQGLSRDKKFLKGSLYYPFVYVAATRHCLAALCDAGGIFSRHIPSACNKECRKYEFRLRHKRMPVELAIKGNAWFFKNDILPEDLYSLNIDRLVYEP